MVEGGFNGGEYALNGGAERPAAGRDSLPFRD